MKYVEIEGFKTEREFLRSICKQLIGIDQDLTIDDTDSAAKRLDILIDAAEDFLLMDGNDDHNLGGIL